MKYVPIFAPIRTPTFTHIDPTAFEKPCFIVSFRIPKNNENLIETPIMSMQEEE